MSDDLLAGAQGALDPNKNYLEELVGEGKKFKTVEELAKGKYLADKYVETLVTQKDELTKDFMDLRDRYNAGPKLEELIDQIKSQKLSNDDDTTNSDDDKKAAFDPKQIEDLIANKLTQFKTQEVEQTNYNKVEAKLKEKFGDQYPNVLKARIEQLGLSAEDANSLAKKSPDAFFRTFGLLDQKQDLFQTPLASSTRSDSFAPQGGQKRDYAYYQELRKKQPDLYYSPKIAVQKDRDMLEQGDAFYS